MHSPKIETFDVVAGTNTDPKGFVRSVSEYREEPFGLYMSRSMEAHPRCSWVESWLLPELGIRVTDWWFRPGERPEQDYYIDIAHIDVDRSERRWRTTDHYLDIVLNVGRDPEVIDMDEFTAAVRLGLLDQPTAEQALDRTFRAVIGITTHGNNLDGWLASLGIRLTWQQR